MNSSTGIFVIIACVLVALLGAMAANFAEGPGATILVAAMTTGFWLIFRRFTEERAFITKVFVVALVTRLVFGLVIEIFHLRDFFGGDALTYDSHGARLVDLWYGHAAATDMLSIRASSTSDPGWGMNYLIGFLYLIVGKNIFAAQCFCGVIGAATAPMVYFCAKKIYGNIRVAKLAAIAIAVSPAMVVWSSQLLKDGLIIFLLVLAMTMVLQLQEKFSVIAAGMLVGALFCILSIRFYIFYMVTAAVVGSFLIGTSNTLQSIVRRSLVLIFIGGSLTYFGVIRNVDIDITKFGSLERLQISRQDLSTARSGFSEDSDVSTTQGAVSTIPVGMWYLMFAPFPWDAENLRQSITIPEVLLWWSLMPFMVSGIWYTLKYRLRRAFPVLFFSLMLTLVYSIFQGNVGTAYRQRTQIQVFLLIFVAVGISLVMEKREDRKLKKQQQGQLALARLHKPQSVPG